MTRFLRGLRAAAAGAALVSLTLLAPSANSQPVTTNAAVERLFAGTVDPNWFDPTFLAQVPAQQIAAFLAQLVAEFGPVVEVGGEGAQLTTRLERAELPTQIALDAEGQIVGLFFGNPVPVGGTVDDFIRAIAELPGQTSVIVLTNGALAAGHQPELPLGVGSAFKLAVLAALNEAAAPGTLVNLDDVAILDPAWRSLPTGILQDWTPGTAVTVATLANLMISISDNTATDALIHILGRETIEAVSPRNTPFLTTAELFKLKSVGNEALLQAWIAGDEAARRAILADLADDPLPAVEQLSPAVSLEAEWFFNGFELCALLEATHDMWAFDINPGLARRDDWARIAFKGGSEAGVLNLSTFVVAADGTTHCIVATWNNTEPLDDQALLTPYSGLLRTLAEGG